MFQPKNYDQKLKNSGIVPEEKEKKVENSSGHVIDILWEFDNVEHSRVSAKFVQGNKNLRR